MAPFRLARLLICLLPARGEGQQPVTLLPVATHEVESAVGIAMSRSAPVMAVATRRQILIFGAADLSLLRTIEVTAAPSAVALDPAGTRIFVGDERKQLRVFDAASGATIASVRVPDVPTAIDASAAGDFVAVGFSDGGIRGFTSELQGVRTFQAPDFYRKRVSFVAWGQSDGELFAAAENGATAFWTMSSPTPIRSSSPARTEIVAAAHDFSGDMLAMVVKTLKLVRESGQVGAEANFSVQVVDWMRGRQVAAIDVGARRVVGVAVAPPRTAVSTVDAEGEVVVWNVASGARLATVQGTRGTTGLAFSPDGQRMATVGRDKVELWRVTGLAAAAATATVDFAREFDRRKFEITTEASPLIGRTESFRVAILGLAGLGADSVVARAADNLLASQVAGLPGLTLVEKDALDRVLEELRFQSSGLTSADEAARIGAMLNASRVIVGSVSQLGSVIVISTRVIGVESGAVLGAREIRCNQCRLEDLPEAIQLLARTLFEF